jgi:hypothetical protein
VKTIKFSHHYNKIPLNIKTAVLLGVEAWDVEKLPASFKDYDAEYEGEGATLYYPLPEKGNVIVLFLWGEVGGGVHILFTTIRRCTESKWDYYHNSIGETFAIEIKEETKP